MLEYYVENISTYQKLALFYIIMWYTRRRVHLQRVDKLCSITRCSLLQTTLPETIYNEHYEFTQSESEMGKAKESKFYKEKLLFNTHTHKKKF